MALFPFKIVGGAGRFFDDVRFDDDALFFLPSDGGTRFDNDAGLDDAGLAILESSLSSAEEYE